MKPGQLDRAFIFSFRFEFFACKFDDRISAREAFNAVANYSNWQYTKVIAIYVEARII